MRYPNEQDMQVMGIGNFGEVRRGPDNNLYQWVQGVDGLGNSVGYWKRVLNQAMQRKMRHPRMLPTFAPVATRMPPARALSFLRRMGMSGYAGLGALYEAPDGSVYQVEGFADDELDGLAEADELEGLGQEDINQMMGVGMLGEIRQGPDGNLYQWEIDGLGRSFWQRVRARRKARREKRRARRQRIMARAKRRWRKVKGTVMPLLKTAASFIPYAGPAVSAGITAAEQAGLVGYEGIGALYEAPDGTLYQVQGLADDEDLEGLADEDLEGFADDEDLEGFADDEDLEGFADDEDLEGFGQGYVLEDQMNGLSAYVPQQPPATRWFQPPSQTPRMWQSPW